MCDVTHYITEIKCPFMGENHGKPMDDKNVCINHISQIMLEMLCSSTQECHYVVWKRGDSYIELLLVQASTNFGILLRIRYNLHGMKM